MAINARHSESLNVNSIKTELTFRSVCILTPVLYRPSLAELYNLVIEHTSYEQYLKTEKDNPEVRIENIEELSSNIVKF